jgi:hypothetical protein
MGDNDLVNGASRRKRKRQQVMKMGRKKSWKNAQRRRRQDSMKEEIKTIIISNRIAESESGTLKRSIEEVRKKRRDYRFPRETTKQK